MGDNDDPELSGKDRRRRLRIPIVTMLLALILGLTVGFIFGYGMSEDSSVSAAEGPAFSYPAPVPVPQPQPCLDASEAGAAVLEQVEQGVRAIGELDPDALRQALDRLQPLQAELEQATADCRSDLTEEPPVPSGSSTVPSPEPTR
ncbi:MAG: hypothetical protein ACRDRK_20050 [Pseudonocardia sp.]